MSYKSKTGANGLLWINSTAIHVRDVKEANKLENQKTPHKCAKFFRKNHILNLHKHRENGNLDKELWFVLLDSEGKKLKWKALTHKDVYERNHNLRGTGFSWARCDPERSA